MTANILDNKWRYVDANSTNIRVTFARERKRLAELEKARVADEAEAAKVVAPIRKNLTKEKV